VLLDTAGEITKRDRREISAEVRRSKQLPCARQIRPCAMA
jgi:hypothetical protein